MDRETTGSNRDARHMRATDFRSFKHFTPDGVQLSMGRVREAPGSHSSEPTLLEDAFVVTLPLRTYGSRIRRDARIIERFPFVKNVASFHDLHSHWSGHFVEGFDFLHFHVPRESFAQGGHSPGAIRDADLPARGIPDDPIITTLSGILENAFDENSDTSALFIEHVTNALHAHVAHTYLKLPVERLDNRGLSPHRFAVAREMLQSDTRPSFTLAQIAQACDMSVTRFLRGFRQSAGLPPHRWLLQQRVAKARELLRGPLLLAEIASLCGFASQSHFTRVFTRIVGTSPGAWRTEFGVRISMDALPLTSHSEMQTI